MKEITVQELKNLKDANEDFQLIDCREPHEAEICSIGGELIPMGELPNHIEQIAKDKKVIIHCRSGARSGKMVDYLEATFGLKNLYNLKGGILAYANEIDNSLTIY